MQHKSDIQDINFRIKKFASPNKDGKVERLSVESLTERDDEGKIRDITFKIQNNQATVNYKAQRSSKKLDNHEMIASTEKSP